MEKLFNNYNINQNNGQSNTDDNSNLSHKNFNTISNLESYYNDDKFNNYSLLNNTSEKEDLTPRFDQFNNFEKQILQKKRKNFFKKRQATEQSLTRKDNMQRICKHLVIENVMKFINKRIILVYEGKIGSGLLKKELVKINQTQKIDSHSNFNKEFLDKSLKDILSENITKRITYYEDDHNKKVIEELIRDKKEEFENLFNISFIDCLEHFAGVKFIKELDGLKLFNEFKQYIINKYSENDESFYYNLEIFIKDYRRRINNSNPKKNKKIDYD